MKIIENLNGKNYLTCSACMSVWADGLSWANAHPEKIIKNPSEADNIIVLSCQVTDLAVLNDLRTVESYKQKFPYKNFFISGCLGKRADIELPKFCERLETPKQDYQFLFNLSLVNFEKPFWTKNFNESDDEKKDGHLFRNMYPLRIGKGCPHHCTYCTIRMTRGKFEKYSTSKLEREFLSFDNVLLVADNPLEEQVKSWCEISKKNNKPFSIRNVEPSVTVKCREELIDLSKNGLLTVFHSPVQSSNSEVLRDMGRNVDDTFETIEISKQLKETGTYIATNIIIDYKNFVQDFSKIYKSYNYVSWNPLWDNVWNRKKAEERFQKYFSEEPKEVAIAKFNTRGLK